MGIDSTLSAVCGLLGQRDVELQMAAIRVLGALKTDDSAIINQLGSLLIGSGNPYVRRAVLAAFTDNPQEKTMKYLVENLEKDESTQELTLNVIVSIGNPAIKYMEANFLKMPQAVQRCIVTVVPRIKTPRAFSFMVESFFCEDKDCLRNTVHTLRGVIGEYNTKDQGKLRDRLVDSLHDSRLNENQSALSAIIISLGIIGQVQVKPKLLPYLSSEYSVQVRRHTLMSLARFEYVGTRHQDVFDAVLPILGEENYDELVRHAVVVLSKIKPKRSDNNKIRKLLENKHIGVKIYAVNALGGLDSITNAESLLELLGARNMKLRTAVSAALRNMPSAVVVILRHIDQVKNKAEAFEMVSILESHDNRIKSDKAKEMISRMLELYFAGDEHYQLYKMALIHLRGDVLQEELVATAEEARKEKDWQKVRDVLKIMDHTELLTSEIRYILATAKLKTSKKDTARSFRQSDYCLDHFLQLLKEKGAKKLKKELVADETLDMNDLYYIGFHFAEQHNEERRFGIDILKHVASKKRDKQIQAQAKEKLKLEGH